MAAVNEIMGKNYIPLDFQDYLVRYCHPAFLYHWTKWSLFLILFIWAVFSDPHHLDADLDPTFHFDADSDPDFHLYADPDLAFHFDADPDPAIYFHADPDTNFYFDVDPDPPHYSMW